MLSFNLRDLMLQPLRIPTGWAVTLNQFYDVDPGADIHIVGLPEGNVWELFLQDLLQLENKREHLLLDLGWAPEASPDGRYVLRLIENEDWHQPVAAFETKSKNDVVENINGWLAKINAGAISMISAQKDKE